MWNSKFLAGSFILVISLLVGCGDGGKSKPDTVDVSGIVSLDGKPLADAEINFISPEGDFAAFGKTDAEGRYTLVQGAVPGKNKVFISKIEGEESEMDVEAGMDAGQFEAANMDAEFEGRALRGPKQLVPADYSDPSNSKLTYDVPEGGTDSADFNL